MAPSRRRDVNWLAVHKREGGLSSEHHDLEPGHAREKKRWSAPRIITSELTGGTDKLSTSQEETIDPGYAFPRTLGPS